MIFLCIKKSDSSVRFLFFSNIYIGSLIYSLEVFFKFLEVENYSVWAYHFFSEDFLCKFLCSHSSFIFFQDSDKDISYTSSLVSPFFKTVSSESKIDEDITIFYKFVVNSVEFCYRTWKSF